MSCWFWTVLCKHCILMEFACQPQWHFLALSLLFCHSGAPREKMSISRECDLHFWEQSQPQRCHRRTNTDYFAQERAGLLTVSSLCFLGDDTRFIAETSAGCISFCVSLLVKSLVKECSVIAQETVTKSPNFNSYYNIWVFFFYCSNLKFMYNLLLP